MGHNIQLAAACNGRTIHRSRGIVSGGGGGVGGWWGGSEKITFNFCFFQYQWQYTTLTFLSVKYITQESCDKTQYFLYVSYGSKS